MPRTIKKYANRRLYDTTASSHVTLDGIRKLVAVGEDVEIIDDTSGKDVTWLLARQNQAVFGDCIDFAVDQANRTVNATDANDYFSQQVETIREFGEQMSERAQQYADITRLTGEKVKQAGPVVVPAKEKGAKKAA